MKKTFYVFLSFYPWPNVKLMDPMLTKKSNIGTIFRLNRSGSHWEDNDDMGLFWVSYCKMDLKVLQEPEIT